MNLPKLPPYLIPMSAITLLMAALSSPKCDHPGQCDSACAALATTNTELASASLDQHSAPIEIAQRP